MLNVFHRTIDPKKEPFLFRIVTFLLKRLQKDFLLSCGVPQKKVSHTGLEQHEGEFIFR